MKDRLWFFGAYDHVTQHASTAQVTTGPDASGDIDQPRPRRQPLLGQADLARQRLEHRDRHACSAIPPTTTARSGPSSARRRPTTARSDVGGTDFGCALPGTCSRASGSSPAQFGYHHENDNDLPGSGRRRDRRTRTTRETSSPPPEASGAPTATACSTTKKFTRYDYLADAQLLSSAITTSSSAARTERIDADVVRTSTAASSSPSCRPSPTTRSSASFTSTVLREPRQYDRQRERGDRRGHAPQRRPRRVRPGPLERPREPDDQRRRPVRAAVDPRPRQHHLHQRQPLLAAGGLHVGLPEKRKVQALRLLQRVRSDDRDGHEHPVAERRARRRDVQLRLRPT